MICYGLTPNEEKQGILDLIKASRSLMRDFSDMVKSGSEFASEYYVFIDHEQKMIKKYFATLIEIERERIKEGLEPDSKRHTKYYHSPLLRKIDGDNN